MRRLEGLQKTVVDIIAAGFAFFTIYAVLYTVPFYVTLPLYICLNFILIFCLYPASKKSPGNRMTVLDLFLCLMSVIVTVFFLHEYSYYVNKAGLFRPIDTFMGTVTLLLGVEVCRRVLGWALPILTILGLAYALWGFVIPGPLGHPAFSYNRVLSQVFSFNGIYGTITAVYATYVMLFVVFGQIIQATGMSTFILELSDSILGKVRGGTAKTAALSSAGVGMVCGSGAANVAITGAFTIPLMKKVGYPPYIAGAIETVAGAGGVLMPPIMGSAAFLLATFTNTSYRNVCIISFLPAILYYWGLYIQIHFISYKYNIRQITEENRESLWNVMKRSGHMLIPIATIFVLIFEGITPYRAAIWSIAVTLLAHYIRPVGGKRMTPREVFHHFGEGVKLQLSVGSNAAIIGAFIVAVVLPGLPLSMASFGIWLSHGNLLILIALTAVVSYIFGMGIPMVASYIILEVIAVPTLREAGVPLLTANLVIMWYSLAALWTPPVCVGAFVASGIAHCSPNKIGWYACRLGVALYVIPLLMVYGTIISGTALQIFFATVCISISLYCFGATVEGYTNRRLFLWERFSYCIASLLTIYPHTASRLIGIAMFCMLYIVRSKGRNSPEDKALQDSIAV